MTPDHVRPLLSDLIGAIERTSRAYRSILLHAPGATRGAALDGWPELCEAAHETAARAEEMLGRFGPQEPAPPAFLAHKLADRLRARRALNHAVPQRPGMRLH